MNRRLGRGLDFLMQTGDDAPQGARTLSLELDAVSANPWQPRHEFDEAELEELAQSIRQHGVVQPIVVRKKGDAFELIAGERRLRASRRAGLDRIPAIVRELDDDSMLTIALIENLHRRDLNPVERARAFQRLAEEQQMSHQKIAELSGLGRSTVSNSLRLLDLDDRQLRALGEGAISEGHARTLLAENDATQREQMFQRMLSGDMTVRKAEDEVAGPKKRGRRKRSKEARLLERNMKEAVGLAVRINETGASSGKVVIRYRSLDEFDRFYRHLTGKNPDV